MKTRPFTPFSIRLGYRLLEIDRPVVMAIVNATPDSFFPASRTRGADAVCRRVEALIADGADWIDVGAYSTRPGADDVSPAEELDRLGEALRALRSVAPTIPVSVDTFRAAVAREAITNLGADIINDISGGDLDPDMFATVAKLRVPYILMHTRGTPATMQTLTDYPPGGVAATVAAELSTKLRVLALEGVADVIVDPGFGFAKTVEQNYELLDSLGELASLLERPMLVGVSRKSMITKPLGITAEEALPATTAIHLAALIQGASILRVHDPRQARQAIEIASHLKPNPPTRISSYRINH